MGGVELPMERFYRVICSFVVWWVFSPHVYIRRTQEVEPKRTFQTFAYFITVVLVVLTEAKVCIILHQACPRWNSCTHCSVCSKSCHARSVGVPLGNSTWLQNVGATIARWLRATMLATIVSAWRSFIACSLLAWSVPGHYLEKALFWMI